jgi:hypothetical protein
LRIHRGEQCGHDATAPLRAPCGNLTKLKGRGGRAGQQTGVAAGRTAKKRPRPGGRGRRGAKEEGRVSGASRKSPAAARGRWRPWSSRGFWR